MICRLVLSAILILQPSYSYAHVVQRKSSNDIFMEARSIALVRVISVRRNDGMENSTCASSGEEYFVQVEPMRMIDGHQLSGELCFDQSPALDQTLLIAAGTESYPRWVRAFWPIQENMAQSSPHIRLEPGDWINQLATNHLLVQDVCVEEKCQSVQYYSYVILEDLVKSVLQLRQINRSAA